MEAEDDSTAVPGWMLTFGDMMGLLLTFFILLVSMSEIKQDDKFQGVADSIQERFGNEAGTATIPGESHPRHALLASLVLRGREKRNVGATDAGEKKLLDVVLKFAPEELELTAAQRAQLQAFVRSLGNDIQQKIEIRGRVPSVASRPAGDQSRGVRQTSFETAGPWQVAFARAAAVRDCLVNEFQLDPLQLSISLAAGPDTGDVIVASALTTAVK